MSETIVKNPGKNYLAAARRRRLRAALQTFCALLLTLIVVFPLYWMLISSLKSTDELLLSHPTFFPKELHFENYSAVFQKFPMGRFMFNSLIVTTACTIIQVITGVMAAYAFSKGQFAGRDLLFTLILGALMVPMQVTFIPTYIMVSRLGWMNTYIGLVLPEAVSAYFIFMLRQNFKAVDESYLDAARVDGMGRAGMIRNVLVPMCKPTLVTMVLMSFIGGWNTYFWPSIIANDSVNVRVLTLGLMHLKQSFSGESIRNYHEIMAGALISILPVLVMFAIFQKQMLSGYTKAAMK